MSCIPQPETADQRSRCALIPRDNEWIKTKMRHLDPVVQRDMGGSQKHSRMWTSHWWLWCWGGGQPCHWNTCSHSCAKPPTAKEKIPARHCGPLRDQEVPEDHWATDMQGTIWKACERGATRFWYLQGSSNSDQGSTGGSRGLFGQSIWRYKSLHSAC